MDSSGPQLEWSPPWLRVGGALFRTIGPDEFLDALRKVDTARAAFVAAGDPPSDQPPMLVWKSREMIEGVAALIRRLQPKRILELGVAQGGSVALLAALAPQAQVVAVELSSARVEALDAHLAGQGATDRVDVHYGVDQGDTVALTNVIASSVGDNPFDLVIDDASHQLDLTRRSLDLLLPKVRPGGAFLIEDWAWSHDDYSMIDDTSIVPPGPPLTALVVEALMSVGSRAKAIDRIEADPFTACLWRSNDVLPDDWSLEGAYVSPHPILDPSLVRPTGA